LDVMLPYIDGFTIGTQIRNLNSKIPIIYLTAKGQTEDALMGFGSGGNDYIRKPFSVEELMVRMNNLLLLTNPNYSAEINTDNSTSVSIGQYVFYAGRQELILGDKIKRLSHRETELLSTLTAQKQETVFRKQILDKIWGNDSFFNSRNLDVYITKLRDYLKEDEKIQIITLKGVGYRLVD
jgi:DNA-binding response OmpR family regulator